MNATIDLTCKILTDARCGQNVPICPGFFLTSRHNMNDIRASQNLPRLDCRVRYWVCDEKHELEPIPVYDHLHFQTLLIRDFGYDMPYTRKPKPKI